MIDQNVVLFLKAIFIVAGFSLGTIGVVTLIEMFPNFVIIFGIIVSIIMFIFSVYTILRIIE